MWFKVAEDMHLRVDDVVGFFGPNVRPACKEGVWGKWGKWDEGGRRSKEDKPGIVAAENDATEDAQAQGPGRTDKTARAFALMRDGSVMPTPFGVRALAGRFKKAQDEHKTIATGE